MFVSLCVQQRVLLSMTYIGWVCCGVAMPCITTVRLPCAGTPADVSTSKSNCPIAQADCQNQDALAVRQMSVHEAWEQPNACSAVQQVNTTACAVEAALNAPNHAASQPCSSSDTAAVTDPSDRHHCSSPHNAAAVVEGLEGQLCSEADAGNLLGEADGVVGLDVICSKHGVQPMPANLTAQDSPAHQLLEHSRAGRYALQHQLSSTVKLASVSSEKC